jgi:hypothetical protein
MHVSNTPYRSKNDIFHRLKALVGRLHLLTDGDRMLCCRHQGSSESNKEERECYRGTMVGFSRDSKV